MADLEFLTFDTNDLLNDIKSKYKELSGEDMEIGSNEMALAATVAYVIGVAKDRFNAMAKQRFLATATGEYLTRIGETLGVSRDQAWGHATFLASVRFSKLSESVTIDASNFAITIGNTKWIPMKSVTFSPNGESASEDYVPLIGASDREHVLEENGIEAQTFEFPNDALFCDFDTSTLESVNFYRFSGDTTGGAFDYAVEGLESDETFREYIQENKTTVNFGASKGGYEAKAKWCDARISSAYAAYTSSDSPHNIKITIQVKANNAQSHWPDLLLKVENYINESDWHPLSDSVTAAIAYRFNVGTETPAFQVWSYPRYREIAEARFRTILAEYFEELRSNLGMAYSTSELSRRCLTDNGEGVTFRAVTVTSGINDYWKPDDDKFLEFDASKATVNMVYGDEVG